jgi:hypothetical protein
VRLFSYIIVRDYGFAPNPFFGCCTLATCKPMIRSNAGVGDWVIANGGKTKYNREGCLFYAMKVEKIISFSSYWKDPRFRCKRPVLNGSLKQLYGDNIYHWDNGVCIQLNSHHSLDDGQPNQKNIEYDTTVDKILVSEKFVYYGSEAIKVPTKLRRFRSTGEDICCDGRGHRVKTGEIVHAFEDWLNDINKWGVQGLPIEFLSHKRIT